MMSRLIQGNRFWICAQCGQMHPQSTQVCPGCGTLKGQGNRHIRHCRRVRILTWLTTLAVLIVSAFYACYALRHPRLPWLIKLGIVFALCWAPLIPRALMSDLHSWEELGGAKIFWRVLGILLIAADGCVALWGLKDFALYFMQYDHSLIQSAVQLLTHGDVLPRWSHPDWRLLAFMAVFLFPGLFHQHSFSAGRVCAQCGCNGTRKRGRQLSRTYTDSHEESTVLHRGTQYRDYYSTTTGNYDATGYDHPLRANGDGDLIYGRTGHTDVMQDERHDHYDVVYASYCRRCQSRMKDETVRETEVTVLGTHRETVETRGYLDPRDP